MRFFVMPVVIKTRNGIRSLIEERAEILNDATKIMNYKNELLKTYLGEGVIVASYDTTVRTDIIQLDELINFNSGSVIEIFGSVSSGKTLLVKSIVYRLLKKHYSVLFYNIGRENTEVIKEFTQYHEVDAAIDKDSAEKIALSGIYDLIVIDNISVDQDRNRTLEVVQNVKEKCNIPVIVVSSKRKYEAESMAPPKLKALCDVRICLGDKMKEVESMDGKTGHDLTLHVIKNRESNNTDSIALRFVDFELSEEFSILTASIKCGIVKKQSIWYYYKNNVIGKGLNKTLQNLQDDKNLFYNIKESLVRVG